MSCFLLFIQEGLTVLREAALSDLEGMEKAKLLVERGANVNIQNEVSNNFIAMPVVREKKERQHERLADYALQQILPVSQ